ncbi:MAG: GAF domain-containing protein, partial [Bacteroidota bacterium]|nr:GAF domain-containing protein [Bacteroidota bacterium]
MKNTFSIDIIPDNDEQRLDVLRRYEILDTPREHSFDRVAELAVKIFNVPIALISLVDKEKVFFKANVGMPGAKTVDRGMSLCSLAVLRDNPTVFENAKEEPCLLANPMVTGSFGLQFYAGAPIITLDGYNIGTVCIVDKMPRSFSEKEKSMLQDLAGIVMDELEVRISAIKALRAKSEIMNIAAHDLKNPLF